MVGKLRDYDVGQQPGGRDTLVDDLCRNGCLDQRFAVIADLLATDMALDGKYSGRVVQLLTDVLTDALECTATWAVNVVRLVMDQGAWKLCRQRGALGLLLFLGRRRSCLQGLKLSFNRRDIGIDQVIEQSGLLRIQLLATLGKL